MDLSITSNQVFKENDILIEFGTAYKIFKVEKQKNLGGEIEPFIFYKPCFETLQNQTVICSIPVSNLNKTNNRRPLSQGDIVQLLELLTKPLEVKIPISIGKAREILESNDAFRVTRLIKRLWFEKNHSLKNLSKTRDSLYLRALKHLIQEIAVVLDFTPEKAKQEILAKLKSIANSGDLLSITPNTSEVL